MGGLYMTWLHNKVVILVVYNDDRRDSIPNNLPVNQRSSNTQSLSTLGRSGSRVYSRSR